MSTPTPSLQDYIFDHAPFYAGISGALGGCLLLIAAFTLLGWPAFALLTAAGVLLLTYLAAASLLIARRKLADPDYEFLFTLGGIEPTDRICQIDVGRRTAGIALCRHLTVGKIFVVDLYNPQLTPNSVLARQRRRLPFPAQDPRLIWLEGQIDLLPLPDNSLTAILLDDALSQFWQAGDRQRLLAETRRVLKPGGRVLVSERTRSLSNWLALGPQAGGLHDVSFWRECLANAGFLLQAEVQRHDLTTCWRAIKPETAAEYQMAFNFGFGSAV